jgi:hypothetical protein
MGDLHCFLVSYSGSYWKQQTDDTPMLVSICLILINACVHIVILLNIMII